jgi:hypothetical protein
MDICLSFFIISDEPNSPRRPPRGAAAVKLPILSGNCSITNDHYRVGLYFIILLLGTIATCQSHSIEDHWLADVVSKTRGGVQTLLPFSASTCNTTTGHIAL